MKFFKIGMTFYSARIIFCEKIFRRIFAFKANIWLPHIQHQLIIHSLYVILGQFSSSTLFKTVTAITMEGTGLMKLSRPE